MEVNVREELVRILNNYSTIAAVSWDVSLLKPPASLAAYEMAQLLIDLEDAFALKLDDLVDELVAYSPAEVESVLLHLTGSQHTLIP